MGTIRLSHGIRGFPFRRSASARRGGFFLRVWDWLAACLDRAAQRRVLATLDDRMLKDIGLTRVDAAQECAKPFWRA